VADLKEPRGRVRFLSSDERSGLLDAAAQISADLLALVTVALCTGARAGELLALRWPDVDLTRGIAIAQDTKNGDRRQLPLTGPALQVLKDRRRVRRIDTDLVFPDPALTLEGKPRPYDYAKDFQEATKRAQIENFRFHDLRHSAASYLAMNGATLVEIAAVLGHKTLAMVKRYAHLTQSHVSGVVERMTQAVFGGGR
jgi:integrase